MSGGSSPAPQSAEERSLATAQAELLQQQRDMLAQQIERQRLLEPMLYEQMGLKPVYEDGKIVRFDKIETEETSQQKEIAKIFRERTLKSLKGELEIDPGLTRMIGDEEKTLRDTLQKQLGAGYETSTPGIEALADFAKRKEETLYGAARGEMSTGQSLGIQREQANAGGTTANLQQLIAAANYSQPSGDPFASASSMMAGLRQDRLTQDQLASQQAAANAQGWGSVGGAVLGAATYAWLACWVAEELFGKDSEKTWDIRAYVMAHHAHRGPIGIFARLYSQHGETWAKYIAGKGWTNRLARRGFELLFNALHKRAVIWLHTTPRAA
jgi:hypothetical protein